MVSIVVENKEVRDSANLFDRLGRLTPTLSDLAFLLPILVLFWSTTGVGWFLTDSDTGWHIRSGQWILKYGCVPKVDLFSFTKTGAPWIAWEWLSDVVMALAHQIGGLAGVVFFAMLLLGLTSVSIYREAVAECGHRFIAIALTWLALSASTIHWLARPHLVTPLMAAVFCRILNSVERKRKPCLLWGLPLLTILWANLHGGFFVGIALICTYAIGAAAEGLLGGSRRTAWLYSRSYLCAAAGCVLSGFINPYGYRLHIHILQYLGTSFYFARISEFQSIDFHSFTAGYFETLLMLAIAAATWHLRSRRFTHALLLLSWSHLALFSARNIPIFAAVAVPGVSLAMREWMNSEVWSGSFKESLRELETGIAVIAKQYHGRTWHLSPCFALLVFATLLTYPGHRQALRAEFDKSRFPVEAAGVLSEQHLVSPIRLYSSWQWGGYLIYRLWPSLRVFDDGRTDFYGPGFVDEGLRAWDANPDWNRILDRYQVNAALLPVDSTLASVMRERDDWKRVYEDRVAVLFAKVETGKASALEEVHMSETSEITVLDARQVVPKPSPTTANSSANGSSEATKNNGNHPAIRRRLPDERHSLTHHFSIGGQEGYATVGLYEDGTPGEMFIRMAKEGSTVSGLMDSFATAVSLALQYGVPLKVLCDKFSHTRFEPSGWSRNPKIGYAKSLMDYLFRWLELRFLKGEQGILFELSNGKQPLTEVRNSAKALSEIVNLGDAPTCQFCGSLMVRNGSCYRCMECGSTSGCS